MLAATTGGAPVPDVRVSRDHLLDPGRLEELLTAAGLPRAQTRTASCHRSERSCLTWSVLHKVLGHPDVRVYDGGWQEYSHLVGAQVCRADPGDGPPG